MKISMTEKQLKERIKIESKETYLDIKRQGGNMTLKECKKETEKILRDNCIIIP